MRLLTVVGTLAMFLVGGGILVHGVHAQSITPRKRWCTP
jgi:predicted DNA repair protein MutK